MGNVAVQNNHLSATRSDIQEPIAIIGMSCRFPGANNLAAFWRLLCEGRDEIREVPPNRFPIDHYYDERPGMPGKIASRAAGCIDAVDTFDAAFFQISPQEATCMDPQHRLLLEVSWEAFEDAGLTLSSTTALNAGVFLGMQTNDHEDIRFRDTSTISAYSALNNARSIAAGRIAYFLNLSGPAIVIDAACSSSLVSVHLACQSLRNGECSIALAGGANLILAPEQSISLALAGMLSSDGRCKFGDARANGFVRSDGFGVIVLKPLAQALADHDSIYAIIRGSAINNDGNYPEDQRRLAKPGVRGQQELLQLAYAQAGIDPSEISYIEAHGTGTSVGDPIELQALEAVLAAHHTHETPCYIGSVKTNIGHTEGAAGIAGLIKTALCLKHRTIVPTLHYHQPNPAIPWERLPFVLPQTVLPWPTTPAYAGVSAFGISGTNAHIVLSEPLALSSLNTSQPAPSASLLPLSARTPEALTALAQRYLTFLQEETHNTQLADICYSASLHRTHHRYRLAFVGQTPAEITTQIQSALHNMPDDTSQPPSGNIVFVFPGQGSQWIGMGRTLLQHEPVFRETLALCEQAFRPYVNWSLEAVLTSSEGASLLEQIDIIQPTLFAIEVALCALWRSWGIEPDAVVGHSMGEVAAAYVAGALTLDDAARIICCRSQLMQRLTQLPDRQGAMLFIELPLEEAQRLLTHYDPNEVSIAASNSPQATVLSGTRRLLEEIVTELEIRQIFCRFIKVDVASHSPHVDALKDDLLAALADLQPRSPRIPIFSTVQGKHNDALVFDAAYWVHNLRKPVLFSQAVQQLLADNYRIFIEISPHPILLSSLQSCFANQAALALGTLQRDTDEKTSLLQTLSTLYMHGLTPDWRRLYPAGGQRVQLPSYPWQRQHFPLPDPHTNPHAIQAPTRYPFIEHIGTSALHTDHHFATAQLNCETFTYLQDHRIRTMIVLPATAYIEMALETADALFNTASQDNLTGYTLENLEIAQALTLPPSGTQTVQMVFQSEGTQQASFQFFSLVPGTAAGQPAWNRHARGFISLLTKTATRPVLPLAAIQQRCDQIYTPHEHYQHLQQRNLHYGPAFQGIARIWKGQAEALGSIYATEAVCEDTRYILHPAWLDACIQVLVEAIPETIGSAHISKKDLFLPVAIKHIQIHALPSPATEQLYWSYARIHPQMYNEQLTGDLSLLDAQGQLLIEVNGIQVQRNQRNLLQDYCYTLHWDAKPLNSPPTCNIKQHVLFTDNSPAGRLLEELLNEAQEPAEDCIVVTPGTQYTCIDATHYQLRMHSADDLTRFFQTCALTDPWNIIYLIGAEPLVEETTAALANSYLTLCEHLLILVQALIRAQLTPSPRLWLVTRGAQAVLPDQDRVSYLQAAPWGLRRALINEHPEITCVSVDLSAEPTPQELHAFISELYREALDQEIAFRDTMRYFHHLVQYAGNATSPNTLTTRTFDTPDPSEQFYLATATPGTLDGLQFYAQQRRNPGPGEVEIRVYASALNFKDVLDALDVVNEISELGYECAGKITALGPGVAQFQVGDEVLAATTRAFSSHVIADARLVIPKPAHLSFEEAITIPGAFTTAIYALKFLARLQPGERILIHSATGGVGLAAVHLAQQLGAEIFATASTPEKHAYLRSLGIKHILNSRTLTFADEIMRLTNGEGVDVILNSLAGVYVQKGLDILAIGGRFLELGKRDIYQEKQLALAPFRKNLSYFAIDLNQLNKKRPTIAAAVLTEIQRGLQDGSIAPLPFRTFPLTAAVDAFRYMMQARHIGKIVLTHRHKQQFLLPALTTSNIIRPHATYLISGGLGGIGITTAQWLVEQGARHLVLIGRSAPSPAVRQIIDEMQRAGAEVLIVHNDIAHEDQLQRLLTDIRQQLPPLRGIIHAAVVLDDGLLMQLNRERCQTVVHPKVVGAWNLHRQTLQIPLDFFVLFSSAATIIAPPGQGNYVMANAFLDALAHHRRASGLPALCLNWGPWRDIGVVATRPQLEKHFEDRGAESIHKQLGTTIFGQLLSQNVTQVAVMSLFWSQWQRFYPAHCASSLLRPLLHEQQLPPTGMQQPKEGRQSLAEVMRLQSPTQQIAWLESYLRTQFAEVRGIAPTQLHVQVPLLQQGLDSLMAVELRNRIQRDLHTTLLVKQLLGHATIQQLAQQILQTIQQSHHAVRPFTSQSEQTEPSQEQSGMLLTQIDHMSEADIDSLLVKALSYEAGNI